MIDHLEQNLDHFLIETVANIDVNIAALSGGATATVKIDAITSVYDTTGAQSLSLVTYSDGTFKYFSDAALTVEVPAAGVTLGSAPATGTISFDQGVVDATTQRNTLATEDRTILGKSATAEWVKDNGNDQLVWQEAIYDAEALTWAYVYTVAPGGAAYALTGTVEPASVSSGEVITVAKIDDVAGDQTGALVNYVQLFLAGADGTTTLIGTKTQDLSADYTVLGTPRNATEIGVNAKTAAFQETLPVGVWVPGALVDSFTYAVFTVGDTLNPPTFTDSDGNVDDLFAGESPGYTIISDTVSFDTTNIKITVNAGDVVKVYGTKLA